MATKKAAQAEPAGYAEAMREIEAILAELDSSNVDVDALATKVERASYLVKWCNQRITAAEMTVESMVADLDLDEPGTDEELNDDLDDDDDDDLDDDD